MFDREAIEALCEAQAIAAADAAVSAAVEAETAHARGVVYLPSDFTQHDLEPFLPTRRRARGHMNTTVIDAFAQYVERHADNGASVFVDPQAMKAVAVLNLGYPYSPGHADNTATLAAKQTAAFLALQQILRAPVSQRDLAEFLEDWGRLITCYAEDDLNVPLKLAVDAVRRLTIEEQRRLDSQEQNLSASRSTFEQVKAAGTGNNLPSVIRFTTVPYMGLNERDFGLRLSVLTDGKVPMLRLRLILAEEHAEQMALEFAAKVDQALAGKVSVHVGTYTKA